MLKYATYSRSRWLLSSREATTSSLALGDFPNDSVTDEQGSQDTGCSTKLLALATGRSQCDLTRVTAKTLFRWAALDATISAEDTHP